MSWWYEQWTRTSEKNGLIRVRRILGRWKVTVGGWDETSAYMTSVWRFVAKTVPRREKIKTILVLGLGAGGTIEMLHRLFHDCRTTTIEWDPVMVEITERLRLYSSSHAPRVIVADAREALPRLEGCFDLILFDLFRGNKAAEIFKHEDVCRALSRLLAPKGSFFFNGFQEPELFRDLDRFLACHRTWKFKWNRVALFRHFGLGRIGDPLPTGYVQFRQDEAYLKRQASVLKQATLLGQKNCYGFRWKRGPLWFEHYVSDEEPVIREGPSRVLIWQPVTKVDRPRGWWRMPVQTNQRQTGFAEIRDPEKYWESWSAHAERHRGRWLKEDRFTIEETDFATFLPAYRRLKKLWWLKNDFIRILEKKVRAHGSLVHFFVARERSDKTIRAGFAFLVIPESSQSVHLLSFIQPEAQHSSVGTGLMDEWFKFCIAHQIRFLDFDIFWAPGEPREWKGFSRFKSQFVTHFIRYPNPLVRWVRGAGTP